MSSNKPFRVIPNHPIHLIPRDPQTGRPLSINELEERGYQFIHPPVFSKPNDNPANVELNKFDNDGFY